MSDHINPVAENREQEIVYKTTKDILMENGIFRATDTKFYDMLNSGLYSE